MILSLAFSAAILVPVFYGEQGAFGSEWRTVFNVRNEGDAPVAEIPHLDACAIPEGCPAPLAAHSDFTYTATTGFKYTNGFFLYPPDAAPLSYAVRVYDVSRSASTYGTSLPVVPLSAFRETPLQILDIPGDGNQRLTLRVYGLPNDRADVAVRIYRFNATAPLTETKYQLGPSITPGAPQPFQRPSGLMTNFTISDPTATALALPYRVTVTSLTPGAPVWAMITATNNDTQQVTVFWPR